MFGTGVQNGVLRGWHAQNDKSAAVRVVGQREKALPRWAMMFAPAFPFGTDDNLCLAIILEGDPV
jgi:hypothetical protein